MHAARLGCSTALATILRSPISVSLSLAGYLKRICEHQVSKGELDIESSSRQFHEYNPAWQTVDMSLSLQQARQGGVHDALLCACAGEGSFLQHFFRATAATSAKERGRYLADPPAGTPRIDDAHAVRLLSPQPRARAVCLLRQEGSCLEQCSRWGLPCFCVTTTPHAT